MEEVAIRSFTSCRLFDQLVCKQGDSQSLVWANSFQCEGCYDHVVVETLRNIYLVFQQRHYHKDVRFQTVQFGWLLFEPTDLDGKDAMIMTKFKHLVFSR